MRKTALILLPWLLPLTAAAQEFYTLDPAHTYPNFKIDHLGFSTTYGRFDQTSGRFMLDRKNNTGSVEVKIAAVSVNTGHQKRDDHLRSPDFLNVMEFPDIVYKSNKVTLTGENQAVVEGTLTMLGVAKPVTLNVHRLRCGEHPMNKKRMCGFDAIASIKRSDFGMIYALPGVGDDMEIMLQAEGFKD